MRRLLDINTWIALTVESHPHHLAAFSWYARTAILPGELLFCRQTELGYLLLITQASVMNRCGALPLSNAEAVDFLARLQADPAVSRANEPPGTRELWLKLAALAVPATGVWMDAYLAAFAIGADAQFITFDGGFFFV
jgi:toxin-antitoxin system PIN domain toxin